MVALSWAAALVACLGYGVGSVLQSIGARIYRTDQDGEITLMTDGRSVSVGTFVGEMR